MAGVFFTCHDQDELIISLLVIWGLCVGESVDSSVINTKSHTGCRKIFVVNS